MLDTTTPRLSRTLEPEIMDSDEEARDYDAMDHAEVNSRFCADFFDFIGKDARFEGALSVLDVGTGTALIPIELCRQRPNLRACAVDLADAMLRAAAANVARAGLSSRITLTKGDAKRIPFGDASFDAVVSNSIVHHIPDPSEFFAELQRVALGGAIFVRDLARPTSAADVSALVDCYAPIPADGDAATKAMHERQRALFDASLRAALTVDEVRAIAAPLKIPAEAIQQTSDRHWTLTWSPADTPRRRATSSPAR